MKDKGVMCEPEVEKHFEVCVDANFSGSHVIPLSLVHFRYLPIIFAVFSCSELGLDENLVYWYAAKIMPNLVVGAT